MFALRNEDKTFVELYHDKNNKKHFSMHGWHKDKCACHMKECSKAPRQSAKSVKCEYKYTTTDVLNALKALEDKFFPSNDASLLEEKQRLYYLYGVKIFHSKDFVKHGYKHEYMKCFPDDIN